MAGDVGCSDCADESDLPGYRGQGIYIRVRRATRTILVSSHGFRTHTTAAVITRAKVVQTPRTNLGDGFRAVLFFYVHSRWERLNRQIVSWACHYCNIRLELLSLSGLSICTYR